MNKIISIILRNSIPNEPQNGLLKNNNKAEIFFHARNLLEILPLPNLNGKYNKYTC